MTNQTLAEMKDLAPTIHRQRLIIEGYPAKFISDTEIKDYLSKLSKVTEMIELTIPVTHQSDRYGWAGWIHWETSGSHFYAWDDPLLFFSVDIYTCKPFSVEKTVAFTKEYFDASEIVFREA